MAVMISILACSNVALSLAEGNWSSTAGWAVAAMGWLYSVLKK